MGVQEHNNDCTTHNYGTPVWYVGGVKFCQSLQLVPSLVKSDIMFPFSVQNMGRNHVRGLSGDWHKYSTSMIKYSPKNRSTSKILLLWIYMYDLKYTI